MAVSNSRARSFLPLDQGPCMPEKSGHSGQRQLKSPFGALVCEMRGLPVSHENQMIPSGHFSSAAQSCPTLCNPMDCSTPGLPVHHQPPEFTQPHVHQVSDAIQPSHPLSSPSPAFPSIGVFSRVSSLHQVAKVLEFQLQHQSFQ